MSPSLRRSARLAAFASQSNTEHIQGQQDALPAFPNLREQPRSTTRKRTTTDSEWGVNERMRKRLRVQSEIGSPSAPAAAIHIHVDWKGVYLPHTVPREIPSSGVTTPSMPSPGVSHFTNANVMTPLHILARWSLDNSTGQEERDDFSVCDIPPLPLNHLEDLPEQRRLVEAYFYALPPLISLRVAILRNTYEAEPVSVLGRGTPVDRPRMDAWGAKRHGIRARCAGNGMLQGTPTPRTPMRPGPPGQQMTGVGRGTPVDPARRAARSTHSFTARFDTRPYHETSKRPCY
ncbi:hypothetical protein B0H14DRAFT_2937490 [Mycena olivaceomarginata]|nr:hypothetical protein B0H14DRAFT_2937490 [Mycena olivaceomarginata]